MKIHEIVNDEPAYDAIKKLIKKFDETGKSH